MAIQPLDLQTLFAQMNHVSKEQAAQKNVPITHQALQAQEMAQNAEERDHAVNQTADTEENHAVRNERRGGGNAEGGESEQREKPAGEEAEAAEAPEKSVFSDPRLGRHVDISG